MPIQGLPVDEDTVNLTDDWERFLGPFVDGLAEMMPNESLRSNLLLGPETGPTHNEHKVRYLSQVHLYPLCPNPFTFIS